MITLNSEYNVTYSVTNYKGIIKINNIRYVPYMNSNMSFFAFNANNMKLNLNNFKVNYSLVTNMYNAYCDCTNLTGSPVCGDNVVNMYYTYHNCANLTGSPVCGNSVTDMCGTYYGCTNLTGSPVCGDGVIDMHNTYYNCTNLTGSPVCGDNVVNMYQAYYNCTNIQGIFNFDVFNNNNNINVCNAFFRSSGSNLLTIQVNTSTDCNKIIKSHTSLSWVNDTSNHTAYNSSSNLKIWYNTYIEPTAMLYLNGNSLDYTYRYVLVNGTKYNSNSIIEIPSGTTVNVCIDSMENRNGSSYQYRYNYYKWINYFGTAGNINIYKPKWYNFISNGLVDINIFISYNYKASTKYRFYNYYAEINVI